MNENRDDSKMFSVLRSTPPVTNGNRPSSTAQCGQCLGVPVTTKWNAFFFIQGVYKWMVQFQKLTTKFVSHLTRAQRTPSAAAIVQVSHALPAVRFSCVLRGRGASLQDGVAAGKGFLCTPFWSVHICGYSAAWISWLWLTHALITI